MSNVMDEHYRDNAGVLHHPVDLRDEMRITGMSNGRWEKCSCGSAAECACWPVENPWTYYGIVEPGGALEPNPECPVYFPAEHERRNKETR